MVPGLSEEARSKIPGRGEGENGRRNEWHDYRETIWEVRFFTGVVVRSAERERGIGAMLLYCSLHDIKAEGLRTAEVETRDGITAANYLYPKYGGKKHTVQG